MGEGEPYEALSYCWGDASVKVPIIVNGKMFPVTTNLFAALRKLRKTDSIRRIWIDAICINQDDNNEKSTQVLLMRDIYQNTGRCFVWLGEFEDAKPMTNVLNLIRKAKDSKITPEEIRKMTCEDRFRFWERLGLLDIDGSAWKTVDGIMNAHWWDRVWVIQEITFPKRVTVFCGNEEWDWDEMIELCQFLYKATSESPDDEKLGLCEMASYLGNLRKLSHLREDHVLLLSQILLKFKGRGATDPKDNVFALLSMDFDQGEITAPVRGLELWMNYRTTSWTLKKCRDKLSNTPLEDLSGTDLIMTLRAFRASSRAKEAYDKFNSTHHMDFVEDEGVLKREKDSVPFIEFFKIRLSKGNELRREKRHSNLIESIQVNGSGTRSTLYEGYSKERGLLADYNMSIREVYTMTMQRLLYYSSDLKLFLEIDHSLANEHGLPSWTIDWSKYDALSRKRMEGGQYSATCDSTLVGIPDMNGQEIQLEGYQVETIHQISQFPLKFRSQAGMPFITLWKEMFIENMKNPATAEELERTFYHTILGRDTVEEIGTAGVTKVKEIIQILMEAIDEGHQTPTFFRLIEDVSTGPYLARAHAYCWNREMIVTNTGKVGLVPATAAIGDSIFLLRGGNMPFVLREKKSKGKEHKAKEQLQQDPVPKREKPDVILLESVRAIFNSRNEEDIFRDESPDPIRNDEGNASKWELIGHANINGMMDGEEWVEGKCWDVTLV
ncbi:hypothetical protein ACHAP3_004620 [Botrytis cinerea]